MKVFTFPFGLMLLALFSSCNNNSGRSGVRQQLSIPRGNMEYDSNLLSPGYISTSPQNVSFPQPTEIAMDPLAAQALAQTQNGTNQPLDTGAFLLAKGLNPPHGYPGHLCELKVGEPLSSKPEIKPANGGLNPAHGQPGHRCDIAVGAPLNSKPVTSTASNGQTNALPAALTAVKNGLNPAHGQPGHRCDIAVGAPLDSKPATTDSTQINQAATNTIVENTVKTDSVKN